MPTDPLLHTLMFHECWAKVIKSLSTADPISLPHIAILQLSHIHFSAVI